MKKKRNKIILFSLLVILIIGCAAMFLKVNKKNKLYETDIQGEWISKALDVNLTWVFYDDLCIQEDYSNHFQESSYTIEKIAPHFYKINAEDLHVDNYQYYNIIGQVFDIQGDIPNAEKFNLVIQDGSIKIEFNDSGICKYYFDFYSDGNLQQMWEMNYCMKNNVIYNIDDDVPRYYLVNNFLFDPIYYKK